MPLLTGVALLVAWGVDHIAGVVRSVIARRQQPQRAVLAPVPSAPVPTPPPVLTIDTEQLHQAAMHELHRQRAEDQAIAVLLGSIDTAGYPFKWREAQRMAAAELGVSSGLVYIERARLRFIELGGGEHPPFVGGQRVLEPVATVPDALTSDDEAIAARLLGWLADGEERC